MITDSSQVETERLRTDFVSFQNRAGLRIAACWDRPDASLQPRPWVLVAPKYGETKKNNLHLAYYLAANGANVLRFDQTNHVGESEGRMEDFTLPGAVEDIVSCLDYLEGNFGVTQAVVVSNSLSARCALRAAVRDARVTKLISVAGVVNLQATLREVYREDIFGTYLAGRHWGITDILGFDINGESFLGTAVAAQLHDLAGTIGDVKQLRVPLVYFYAERDTWVDSREVAEALDGNPQCRRVLVQSAMHEVRENPRAAEAVFRQVVWASLRDDPYNEAKPFRLRVPGKKLVLQQNRLERERMRRAETPDKENEFWSGYLKKYSVLEKSTDYRAYLDLVGRLCGPLAPGALVLDAGCGNGMLGLWILREAWRRNAFSAAVAPLVYVGLDLTAQGLSDALGHHLHLRHNPGPAARPDLMALPGLQYSLVDFDQMEERGSAGGQLAFRDGTFDVACCSLVLSYLQRPQRLLQELHRVLRPGGTLVASSMKPHCDMSVIYRDFIGQQVTAGELEAARNLLRAAGRIKLKEEIGYYAFFSQTELAGLVTAAGFNIQEAHHSLGDQAVVVKATR
ncbi:MAG: methyltransferase domain-containing protein [Opitutaceae bacterium]|nr:methyltransferase domain-containing protein [Opitutaceae bacterium]